MREDRVLLLGCGIFAREFRLLEEGLRACFEPRFLDSMLHMRPAELEARLRVETGEAVRRPRVYLYGDCCPGMEGLASAEGAARTRGMNCIEIALGPLRYRELRREGAFFFMPEWMGRWEEVFRAELGFERPGLAADFLRESAARLVYVDTGALPPPREELERASRSLGLPMLVEGPGLGPLAAALSAALDELGEAGFGPRASGRGRRA